MIAQCEKRRERYSYRYFCVCDTLQLVLHTKSILELSLWQLQETHCALLTLFWLMTKQSLHGVTQNYTSGLQKSQEEAQSHQSPSVNTCNVKTMPGTVSEERGLLLPGVAIVNLRVRVR